MVIAYFGFGHFSHARNEEPSGVDVIKLQADNSERISIGSPANPIGGTLHLGSFENFVEPLQFAAAHSVEIPTYDSVSESSIDGSRERVNLLQALTH